MSRLAADVDVDVEAEVAVVGGGLMGAATAWALARRGVSVALIEAADFAHPLGSSHGSSRIFRRTYTDPFYVGLTGRAYEAWREAEHDTGRGLLRLTGGLDVGEVRGPARLRAELATAGVECELLTPTEAADRFPGMRFDGPALLHPQAGVLDPEAAIRAWAQRVASLGGLVLSHTAVRSVEMLGGGVLLRTAGDGPTVRAATAVVAVGGWLPELLGNLGVPAALPPITVTQQQVFHFALRDPTAAWPVLVHKAAEQLYALPSGPDGGPRATYKVAQYDGGRPTTASGRDGVIDPGSRALVVDYVARWLPGLEPEPTAEGSCLFTNTPDEDFVLDRAGPVVIASPCSGHGAKFAPLIGEMAADLATGLAAAEPRFAFRP